MGASASDRRGCITSWREAGKVVRYGVRLTEPEGEGGRAEELERGLGHGMARPGRGR